MRLATMMMALLALITTTAVADQFGDHWYDGKAELDGYRLKVSRYKELRDGTAVMIFVTEPFSESERVKVNDHKKNPSDVVDVLKLNLVRDFQTGIYDYNTMTSVFVRSSDFEPLKLTFSSAEWCGHVFTEMIFREKVEGHISSYFEGESGDIDMERPEGSIVGDNLFVLLRGLRGDYLGAGESKRVKLLPGAYYSRLTHRPIEYTDATISRAAAIESITVPAGSFEVMRYDVTVGDDRRGVFWIESAYPHRIVRWELPPDASGELTGSARLEYWRLNGEGDESYLEQIGLGGSTSP
jgi:hypothetical protein